MVESDMIIQNLERILGYSSKLNLENKESEELEIMLKKHQKSPYRKIMDLFGKEYSKKNRLKEIVIKKTLEHRTESRYE